MARRRRVSTTLVSGYSGETNVAALALPFDLVHGEIGVMGKLVGRRAMIRK